MPFLAASPYQELLPLPDGRHWRTTKPLVFRSARHARTILVPGDYVTDGASIPRLLWWLVGHPLGGYHPAALVHDRLYETHEARDINGKAVVVSRGVADDILREACLCLPSVSGWQRHALYSGVRVGGWYAWGKGPEKRAARQAMAAA